MQVVEFSVGGLTYIAERKEWFAQARVVIEDGKVRQNIRIDLFVEGTHEQTLGDVDASARAKASALLGALLDSLAATSTE